MYKQNINYIVKHVVKNARGKFEKITFYYNFATTT